MSFLEFLLGNTFEVEKVLELANAKGATTISLTKIGQSPISQISQIQLYPQHGKRISEAVQLPPDLRNCT